MTLIVLLMQLPTALLLVLVLVIRGWGSRTDEHAGPPPMDWVPVLWLGAFTLVTLVIAWAFLRSAHPFAGTLQLLVGTVALIATLTVWHEEYERVHQPPLPPCPTKAGILCAPSDSAVDPWEPRPVPGSPPVGGPSGMDAPAITAVSLPGLRNRGILRGHYDLGVDTAHPDVCASSPRVG